MSTEQVDQSTTGKDLTDTNEKPQITKPEKEKNPNRVAAGKRLAAYSKAAKAKIAAREPQPVVSNDIKEEDIESTDNWDFNTMTILTGVGVLTGIACLYYTYKQDKRNEKTQHHEVVPVTVDHLVSEPLVKHSSFMPKSRLRSFD